FLPLANMERGGATCARHLGMTKRRRAAARQIGSRHSSLTAWRETPTRPECSTSFPAVMKYLSLLLLAALLSFARAAEVAGFTFVKTVGGISAYQLPANGL